MKKSTKAIIIGAGIGGLSAAIALQQIGYEVAIYERTQQIKPVGAGISLWPNAIKALDQLSVGQLGVGQLNVGQGVRALGTREIGGGIHNAKGQTLLATSMEEADLHFGAPTIIIHRADLSQLLHDAYKGELHLGKNFTHYSEEASTITAYFGDASSVSGDLLICADGIHSLLRQSWFPTSVPLYAGYTAWRGVVPFDHAQVGNLWGETLGSGPRFGLAPLSEGRVYWYATQSLPEKSRVAPDQLHTYLLSHFGKWEAPIPAIIRATPSESILQNDIYYIDPLTEWVRGHAALLGDSAHAMTPDLGQGGCQAIEDAVVLGKSLQGAATLADGLRAYQSQRLSRANHISQLSRRIGTVVTQSNPLVCAIRDLVFRLTPTRAHLRNLEGVIGYEV